MPFMAGISLQHFAKNATREIEWMSVESSVAEMAENSIIKLLNKYLLKKLPLSYGWKHCDGGVSVCVCVAVRG